MSSILTTRRNDRAVIATPGVAKFDVDSTRRLQRELGALAAESDSAPLLLDLSAVEFLPSGTIGVLVELANKCRGEQRGLALIGLQPKVAEVLRLCSLDEVFAIHADENEALSSL